LGRWKYPSSIGGAPEAARTLMNIQSIIAARICPCWSSLGAISAMTWNATLAGKCMLRTCRIYGADMLIMATNLYEGFNAKEAILSLYDHPSAIGNIDIIDAIQ